MLTKKRKANSSVEADQSAVSRSVGHIWVVSSLETVRGE